MLVLSRKQSQSITITMPDGREIVVSVVDFIHNRVRLGITAPKDVLICRDDAVNKQVRNRS